ncbi:hypothetical protein [Bradyrhizobium sp. CCGB01]|uniref:hypothetical protein n=1 Tax=Bradyrhizobium sp. CCGB01 TaxID=2949634 RepID=UPI0020B2B705|nr:hypothetical protein [Bradyrhizobium sp. CCGB01]MCP3411332.1 hypothetical protein [Bradyrhizobium sp. CCGB01]
MQKLRSIVCFVTCSMLCGSLAAVAQQPPVGYFDIPPGFDYPANKQTLEQYRTSANVPAQRLHVWNVFAGMTQTTPDGKYPIFETWFSEDEVFKVGPEPQAVGPRRIVRRFKQPAQLSAIPGELVPQAAGTALLSEVLYNYAGYKHVRTNRLYLTVELDALRANGAPDSVVPGNRIIPVFPSEAISLKTVWWPIARDQVTALPVWDPESNPPRPAGNPFTTWARVVAVDPNQTNVPPNATRTVFFLGKQFPNSHLVGIDAFHAVKLDAQTAQNAMANDRLARAAELALGRPLQEGDYVVLVASHLTTKEIDDWVWATLWWHDRPDDGPFAADRPAKVVGVWRNFLMSATYDLDLPREPDGKPHIAFNPWLEAGFPDPDGGSGNGTVSNCMNCHNRSAWRPDWQGQGGRVFLPIFRGKPDLQNDPAYAAGRLRTDFLWSVPFNSQ